MYFCKFLFVAILLSSVTAIASNKVGNDGLLRNEDGKLAFLSQTEAIKACAGAGMHLPSDAELENLYNAAGRDAKDEFAGYWFWSSSCGSDGWCFVLDGSSGTLSLQRRGGQGPEDNVWCMPGKE